MKKTNNGKGSGKTFVTFKRIAFKSPVTCILENADKWILKNSEVGKDKVDLKYFSIIYKNLWRMLYFVSGKKSEYNLIFKKIYEMTKALDTKVGLKKDMKKKVTGYKTLLHTNKILEKAMEGVFDPPDQKSKKKKMDVPNATRFINAYLSLKGNPITRFSQLAQRVMFTIFWLDNCSNPLLVPKPQSAWRFLNMFKGNARENLLTDSLMNLINNLCNKKLMFMDYLRVKKRSKLEPDDAFIKVMNLVKNYTIGNLSYLQTLELQEKLRNSGRTTDEILAFVGEGTATSSSSFLSSFYNSSQSTWRDPFPTTKFLGEKKAFSKEEIRKLLEAYSATTKNIYPPKVCGEINPFTHCFQISLNKFELCLLNKPTVLSRRIFKQIKKSVDTNAQKPVFVEVKESDDVFQLRKKMLVVKNWIFTLLQSKDDGDKTVKIDEKDIFKFEGSKKNALVELRKQLNQYLRLYLEKTYISKENGKKAFKEKYTLNKHQDAMETFAMYWGGLIFNYPIGCKIVTTLSFKGNVVNVPKEEPILVAQVSFKPGQDFQDAMRGFSSPQKDFLWTPSGEEGKKVQKKKENFKEGMSLKVTKQDHFKTLPKEFIVELKRSGAEKVSLGNGSVMYHTYRIMDPLFVNPVISLESIDGKKKQYEVMGIICQRGNLEKGHYFCFVKNGKKWIKYDDTSAKEVSMEEAILEASNSTARGFYLREIQKKK
ncbi:ubiquitin carboxyl-terminal hydrolase [Candidatus Margulisiibacteriota bacterium]